MNAPTLAEIEAIVKPYGWMTAYVGKVVRRVRLEAVDRKSLKKGPLVLAVLDLAGANPQPFHFEERAVWGFIVAGFSPDKP